ncbi:MAG: ABC transporter substrate-binding protein [Christensenellales bacterium]
MAKQKKTMKMKKIYIVSMLIVMLVAFSAFSFAGCEKADYTVGVIQLLPHVALDKAYEGFTTELDSLMSEAGKTVKYEYTNSNGEASNNSTNASTLVNKNVDLIYTIATSPSVAAANATKTIPIVFSAVTDPVAEKLVATKDAPGANVTGCSDMNPIEQQAELMKLVVKDPATAKYGVLYSAKENNSKIQADMLIDYLGADKVTRITINDATEIASAMGRAYSAGVECLYIPTDNILATAAASVHSANVSGNYNIPIVGGEGGINDACGVVTYSVDYYELGRVAAKMAFDILVNGKNPAEMPVGYQTEGFALSINTTVADEIGYTIPDSILALQ